MNRVTNPSIKDVYVHVSLVSAEHPFSIPSRDNLPRPLPLLPEPRPPHSQPFLARSHSLDDLHSAGGGGGSGAEESENLGGYRQEG